MTEIIGVAKRVRQHRLLHLQRRSALVAERWPPALALAYTGYRPLAGVRMVQCSPSKRPFAHRAAYC